MLRILIVNIGKGHHEKSGSDVHENIDLGTARVEELPKPGDVFAPTWTYPNSQRYRCLRLVNNDKDFDFVPCFDAVVFTEFVGH